MDDVATVDHRANERPDQQMAFRKADHAVRTTASSLFTTQLCMYDARKQFTACSIQIGYYSGPFWALFLVNYFSFLNNFPIISQ